MTELSFLIDLLLNHELQKVTKDAIASRIKDVEETLVARPYIPSVPQGVPVPMPPNAMQQSPSTLAAMARQAGIQAPIVQPPPAVPQVEQIAQTQATAAALAARQQALSEAMSNPFGKGTKSRSARKF